MARRSSNRWFLALLRRAFGWETEKWDLRLLAKTDANSLGEQLGKLGEEEEEPATERMEYTD